VGSPPTCGHRARPSHSRSLTPPLPEP
jgi:hypothetical protein